MSDSNILEVKDLQVHFPVTEGLLKRQVGSIAAVNGVSFHIKRGCLLYTSPSPRDGLLSRMPSSA